jgi:membrane-associated phospholipid phosphatase
MNVDVADPEELPPPTKKWLSLKDRWEATPRGYVIGCVLGFAAYLGVMGLTIGTRPEQFFGGVLLLATFVWSDTTRRLAMGLLPIIAAGIVYDLTHFTQHLVQDWHLHVHLTEPYNFDKSWFGIPTAAGVVTPNEYFALHHWPLVDFVTGTAYIIFLYWAIGFAVFTSLTGKTAERRALPLWYGWTFFALNVVGYATYYVYPAAPPWYVTEHGFVADFTVRASPAACVRWDDFTGLHYFRGFYGRSADVFGAIPSLHVALPLLVFLYSFQLKRPWWTALAFGFYALVCFSAVYLQHHYVLDIVIGSAYTLIAFAGQKFVTAWLRRRNSSARPARPGPAGE